MKRGNDILNLLLFLALIVSPCYPINLIADDEHSTEETTQTTEPETAPASQDSEATPSVIVKNAELDTANAKALIEAQETTQKLEDLSKELDLAVKEKDSKKVKELKAQFEQLKKIAQSQLDNLEEREYPDGRPLPLSASGKKVAEELSKAQKMIVGVPQKRKTPRKIGLDERFKKLDENALAKWDKEKEQLAKDSMAISTASAVGNMFLPGIGGPLAGAAAASVIAANHAKDSEVSDEPSKAHEQAPEQILDEPIITLQKAEKSTEKKEETPESKKAAGDINKLAQELDYFMDELYLGADGLSKEDIGKIQRRTYEITMELDKLYKYNPNSDAVEKAYKDAHQTGMGVLQRLADLDHEIAYGDNSAWSDKPKPSFSTFADNEIDNNIAPRKPSIPNTASAEDDWLSSAINWAKSAVDSGIKYLSDNYPGPTTDYLKDTWNGYTGSPTPSGDNHITQDVEGNKPANSVPNTSNKDVASAYPSTPSQQPVQTIQPSQPTQPTVPTGPALSNANTPVQAIANSNANAGAQSDLGKRGFGGLNEIPVETTARHLSPYEDLDNSRGTPKETQVTTLPSNARESALRSQNQATAEKPSKENLNTDSQVSFSARNGSGNSDLREKRYRESSNNYASDITSNSNSSSSSTSGSQSGLQPVQPLPQGAVAQSANGTVNANPAENQSAQDKPENMGRISSLRRYGPNDDYFGPQFSKSPLFVTSESPETVGKVAAKNSDKGQPDAKKAITSAYDSAAASNPEFEPKKAGLGGSELSTILSGGEKEKGSAEDELLLGKGITAEIEEKAPEAPEKSGISGLVDLTEDLLKRTLGLDNDRELASKGKVKPKKAEKVASSTDTAATTMPVPATTKSPSFFSRILEFFGV